MYTIGQVSAMFNLPVSTLRYYDKEGFFPNLERKGNIRYFSDNELEALRHAWCICDFFRIIMNKIQIIVRVICERRPYLIASANKGIEFVVQQFEVRECTARLSEFDISFEK